MVSGSKEGLVGKGGICDSQINIKEGLSLLRVEGCRGAVGCPALVWSMSVQ